jgi:hypothetical protein
MEGGRKVGGGGGGGRLTVFENISDIIISCY